MPSFLPQARTTDAVPKVLGGGANIEADSVCRLACLIFASDHVGGAAFWRIDVTTRRVGSNPPGLLKNVTVHQNTAGAAASWAADVGIVDTAVVATVTGVVGQTIDWLYTTDDDLCMTGTL